jgi:hypothetical protein
MSFLQDADMSFLTDEFIEETQKQNFSPRHLVIPHKKKTLFYLLTAIFCTVSCGVTSNRSNPFTTAVRQDESSRSTGPGATFKGCWYKTGGKEYQAANISVKNPGTYPFYANLYYGSTCSQWADDFGNGERIDFGGFGYTFWFDHFPDKKDMSAIWQVGSNKSACIAYENAPLC